MLTLVARQPESNMAATMRNGLKVIQTDLKPYILNKICTESIFQEESSQTKSLSDNDEMYEIKVLFSMRYKAKDGDKTLSNDKKSDGYLVPTIKKQAAETFRGLMNFSSKSDTFVSQHLVENLKNSQSELQRHIKLLKAIKPKDKDNMMNEKVYNDESMVMENSGIEADQQVYTNTKRIVKNKIVGIVKKKHLLMAKKDLVFMKNVKHKICNKPTSSYYTKHNYGDKSYPSQTRKLFQLPDLRPFSTNKMHLTGFCTQIRCYHKRMQVRLSSDGNEKEKLKETDRLNDESMINSDKKEEKCTSSIFDETSEVNEAIAGCKTKNNSDESLIKEVAEGCEPSNPRRKCFNSSSKMNMAKKCQSEMLLNVIFDTLGDSKLNSILPLTRQVVSPSFVMGQKKNSLSAAILSPTCTSNKLILNPYKADFKEYSTANLTGGKSCEISRNQSDHNILHNILISSYKNSDDDSNTITTNGQIANKLQTSEKVNDNIKCLMLNDYLNQGITECMNKDNINIMKYNQLDPLSSNNELHKLIDKNIKAQQDNKLPKKDQDDSLQSLKEQPKTIDLKDEMTNEIRKDYNFKEYLMQLKNAKNDFLELINGAIEQNTNKLAIKINEPIKTVRLSSRQPNDLAKNKMNELIMNPESNSTFNSDKLTKLNSANDTFDSSKGNKAVFTDYVKKFHVHNNYLIKDNNTDMFSGLNVDFEKEKKMNAGHNNKLEASKNSTDITTISSNVRLIQQVHNFYENKQTSSLQHKSTKWHELITKMTKTDYSKSSDGPLKSNLQNEFAKKHIPLNISSVNNAQIGFKQLNKMRKEQNGPEKGYAISENTIVNLADRKSLEKVQVHNSAKDNALDCAIEMHADGKNNLKNETVYVQQQNNYKTKEKNNTTHESGHKIDQKAFKPLNMEQLKTNHHTNKLKMIPKLRQENIQTITGYLAESSKLKDKYKTCKSDLNVTLTNATEPQLNQSSRVKTKISTYEVKVRSSKENLSQRKIYSSDVPLRKYTSGSSLNLINLMKNEHNSNVESMKRKISHLEKVNEFIVKSKEANGITSKIEVTGRGEVDRKRFSEKKFKAIQERLAAHHIKKAPKFTKRDEESFNKAKLFQQGKHRTNNHSVHLEAPVDFASGKKKLEDLKVKIANYKNSLRDTKYSMEKIEKNKQHYDFSITITPDERHTESAKKIQLSKIANNAMSMPFGKRPSDKAHVNLFEKFHNKVKEASGHMYKSKRPNNFYLNEKMSPPLNNQFKWIKSETRSVGDGKGFQDTYRTTKKLNVKERQNDFKNELKTTFTLKSHYNLEQPEQKETKMLGDISTRSKQAVGPTKSATRLLVDKYETDLKKSRSEPNFKRQDITPNNHLKRGNNGFSTDTEYGRNLMGIFSDIKNKAYKFFKSRDPDDTKNFNVQQAKNDTFTTGGIIKEKAEDGPRKSDKMKPLTQSVHLEPLNTKEKNHNNQNIKIVKDDGAHKELNRNNTIDRSRSNVSLSNSSGSDSLAHVHQPRNEFYRRPVKTDPKEIKINNEKLYNAASLTDVNARNPQFRSQNYDYFLKEQNQFQNSMTKESHSVLKDSKEKKSDSTVHTSTTSPLQRTFNLSRNAAKFYNSNKEINGKNILEESTRYPGNIIQQVRQLSRFTNISWSNNSTEQFIKTTDRKQKFTNTVKEQADEKKTGLIGYLKQDRTQNHDRLKNVTRQTEMISKNISQKYKDFKIITEIKSKTA